MQAIWETPHEELAGRMPAFPAAKGSRAAPRPLRQQKRSLACCQRGIFRRSISSRREKFTTPHPPGSLLPGKFGHDLCASVLEGLGAGGTGGDPEHLVD